MSELNSWISEHELPLIKHEEKEWLSQVFKQFNGYPNLEELWALMDQPWNEIGCDSSTMDSRVGDYYAHPVWLLNGLFIEQHRESLKNRVNFSQWVVDQKPKRIAEFGGGFGSLARMIGAALPEATVEVIEPHPHSIAIARAQKTNNVTYQSKFDGEYDIVVATDVFEHVPDPLLLVEETAGHLREGGKYLIANCFYPVIQCHLPQHFHFRYSWDTALCAMGWKAMEKVEYGRAYQRPNKLNLANAREVERRSKQFWEVAQYLPQKLTRPVAQVIAPFLTRSMA